MTQIAQTMFHAKAIAPARGDAQLREFLQKDLGEDIAALKQKGVKRGLPYQTMVKLIVREHIDEY